MTAEQINSVAIAILVGGSVLALCYLGYLIFKRQNDDGWSDYEW